MDPEELTLADVLRALSDQPPGQDTRDDFDILLQTLDLTGLTPLLEAPNASLTAFAPDDGAFIALAQGLGYQGPAGDEAAAAAFLLDTFDALNDGQGVRLLDAVLRYHVVNQALSLADMQAAGAVTTLQGRSVSVGDDGRVVDQEPDFPNQTLLATDVAATNGFAHSVDGVLLPFDIPESNGAGDVDILVGDENNNALRGGSDNDVLLGVGAPDLLRGGVGNDEVDGQAGNDRLHGDGGNDTVIGGSGDDGMRGEAGNDSLLGGSGNDRMFGDAGQDTLEGGSGTDRVLGGSGVDLFVFNDGMDEDRLLDYAAGERLDVSGLGVTDLSQFFTADIGGIAVFRFGDNRIVIADAEVADFTNADFIFA